MKKNVVFLVKNALMLYVADNLYPHLERDPRIRPWVAFTHPERFRSGMLAEARARFRHVPYAAARWWPWDLALYPDHDAAVAPWVRRIYLRHGAGVQKKFNGEIYVSARHAFGRRGFKYSAAFVDSDLVRAQILREHPELEDRLKVVGSLTFQQATAEQRPRAEALGAWGMDPAKRLVVFLSTWGKGLMQNCGEALLEILPRLASEYNVLVSSHPKTAEPNDRGYLEITEKFKALALPRFRFVFDHEWKKALSHTDLLVSDHTSTVAYFLPYVRRVICVDIPGTELIAGSAVAELLNICPVLPDLERIEEAIRNAWATDRKADFERVGRRTLGPYESALERHLAEIRALAGAGGQKR